MRPESSPQVKRSGPPIRRVRSHAGARPEVALRKPSPLAVFALAAGALAAAQLASDPAAADERAAAHAHLRQLAAADVGDAGRSRELIAAWSALAEPALAAAAGGERARYVADGAPRVWRVPPQDGLPSGAAVVDGCFVDCPPCEAERRDLRVVALGAGDGLGAAYALPPNAGPPAVQLVGFGAAEELLVLLRGRIWRGGAYLAVLRWRPGDDALTPLYAVSGEEETTPGLSVALEGGPSARVVVHGLAGGATRALTIEAAADDAGRLLMDAEPVALSPAGAR